MSANFTGIIIVELEKKFSFCHTHTLFDEGKNERYGIKVHERAVTILRIAVNYLISWKINYDVALISFDFLSLCLSFILLVILLASDLNKELVHERQNARNFFRYRYYSSLPLSFYYSLPVSPKTHHYIPKRFHSPSTNLISIYLHHCANANCRNIKKF